MKTVLCVYLLFLLAGTCRAGEADYRDAWCAAAGGVPEAAMPDGTRCDCLTPEYAVEVDYARKWAEAIGQSLHYGQESGRTPGIVLIVDRPADDALVQRLLNTIERAGLDIRVWTVAKDGLCP